MTDPYEFSRILSSGGAGAEHSPLAAARLIEQLARERDALMAKCRELEAIVMSERTKGYMTTAYAHGFRACQQAICLQVPAGSEAENQVMALQPNINDAVRMIAKEAA